MILSICIPSYNRFEKLNETVSSILQAKSTDFEVVVIDNGSPRDIDEYISYTDKRLRIVKREYAVCGMKNIGDSILYGCGVYSLMLLDKDSIIGKELDAFIDTLKNNDVYGGYCELNSNNNSIHIESNRTVEKFGYLGNHPSGYFFRMDILKNYIEEKNGELEKNPFQLDIYLAYCASKGRMLYYDKPVVCSPLNDPEVEDTEGSLTYSKEIGNVYYFPENRNKQFCVYCGYLSELDIVKKVKLEVLYKLYMRTIRYVSTDYKGLMKNPVVCRHYHHEMRYVTKAEMIKNILKLRKVFYKTKCKDVTKKDKKSIEKKLIKKIIKRILCCKNV